MLKLDLQFMLGVYFGTTGPESTLADWPPQPDRAFSALVAAWAAHGKRADETSALKWLEMQSSPFILTSVCGIRDAHTAFVPPNDVPSSCSEALQKHQRRRERRFPAAIPKDPLITYVWRYANPTPPVLDALRALARDTSCVGRSPSFTRCNFSDLDPGTDGRELHPARGWVYPGRLEELERDFNAQRHPSPGASVRAAVATPATRARSHFGDVWHVFADVGATTLDVRDGAIAAHAFRSALLSGLGGRRAPELISGHDAQGYRSRRPHLVIVPMANVGWRWSDGNLMGLALCFPRDAYKECESILAQALRNLMGRQRRQNPDAKSQVAVGLPDGRERTLHLSRQPAPYAASLKPRRYMQCATSWATVTPIVLDYALPTHDPYASARSSDRIDEIVECIKQACTYIGLPKPLQVVPSTYSAIRGSPPVLAPQRKPSWEHWRIPSAVKRQEVTHATMVFPEPVEGPVLLGAGRYYGLGLCLPLNETREG